MATEIVLTSTRRLLIFVLLVFVAGAFVLRIVKNVEVPTGSADRSPHMHNENNEHGQNNKRDVVTPEYVSNTPIHPVMGKSSKHLHTFVQISDLHLSIFKDKDRVPQFQNFCEEYLSLLKPEAVLVTGDLTDAKNEDRQGSKQYLEEWKLYAGALGKSKITEKTVWLDLRGNHDAFDVPSIKSNKNLYRKYSHKGRNQSLVHSYVHHTQDGDSIRFISIDACPDPGPKRPFNFFGIITEELLHSLHGLMLDHTKNNMTVFFGHYPTSVLTGDVEHLREIMGQGSVYLAGHLHTLGGLAPNMYAMQQSGYLELELGDWMDNRIYRVFAVDHGLFSFTDEQYGSWPVVMITNPKHGQFVLPSKESTQSILQSTHIRILAFSPDPITSVSVSIDGQIVGEASHSEGPLYTVPWSPAMYAKGQHTITVITLDAKQRERIVSQPFILDGTRLEFGLFRRFLIMSPHAAEAKIMFSLVFLGTVLPMLLVKFIHITLEGSTTGSCCYSLFQKSIRKYKMLANKGTVFWPLLAFHIYVATGPWFIGEILEGHIGAMFVFGLVVKNTFIPGSLTFLYGFFQMLLFNFPLTWYLAHLIDSRACSHKRQRLRQLSRLHRLWRWTKLHGIVFLLFVFQGWLAIGFYKTYGLMAVLLCPVRTWSVFIMLLLRWLAMRNTISAIKSKDMKNPSG